MSFTFMVAVFLPLSYKNISGVLKVLEWNSFLTIGEDV